MRFLLAFLTILFFTINVYAQSDAEDISVYYKNFVKHLAGDYCYHSSPEATFTAYLNNDSDQVLIENAPRWKNSSDPNISGNGTFGIELGNFFDPKLKTGDSVHVRFTCNAAHEQGILNDSVLGIPWYFFPKTLTLKSVNLPDPPENLKLQIDSLTFHRIISWSGASNQKYEIYRRVYSDTLSSGLPRMVYYRIGFNITTDFFIDSTAVSSEKYGYIVYSVSDEGIHSSHSLEVNEDPYIKPGMDLDISYIGRLPRQDYVWDSEAPWITGWPSVGSTVYWQAVIRNWSDSNMVKIPYKWFLDGTLVDSSSVDIPAGDTVTVNYPWQWTFDRHTLKFVIDPENVVAEEEEENNDLTIYTNAISAGFYVEQSVYDYFHRYQKDLGIHSNSWDDWAQRHVLMWNGMFKAAIYSDSPDGVLDRIRLDKITIVPDNALPLNGGLATNDPDFFDKTIDLQWGFPTTLLDGNFYADHKNVSTNNPFYFEGSLLHELGHARYLIDQYGFNVHDNGSGNTVAIKENGKLIAGTPYLPITGDVVHAANYKGLMNGQYTYVDEYSAAALNLIAGHRAIEGNYNAPGNIGIFLQDLPEENVVTLKDAQGNILSNAAVRIYQAGPKDGEWYGKFYDDEPDLYLSADENGRVALGRCPFSKTGRIEHGYGFSNGVIILRAEYEGKIGYGFLEVSSFNMEYWRGNTKEGNYELRINLNEPSGIVAENSNVLPNDFELLQNFPNPFNPETLIRYRLPQTSKISLEIYDVLGARVRVLFKGTQSSGEQAMKWDGKNERGDDCSSGIYFYKLMADQNILIKKMMLIR